MKLGHGNEFKYDTTVGTITNFVLIMDGQPTMLVTCDLADADRVIYISRADGAGMQATKGHFAIGAKMTEDVDGIPQGVEQRVDSLSVYHYVLPRVPRLLARLVRAA